MTRIRVWTWIGAAALLGIVAVSGIGCSEEATTLETRPVHGAGWVDPGPEDYHGATVQRVGYGSCARCHGEDQKGGVSGYACSRCHSEPPIE